MNVAADLASYIKAFDELGIDVHHLRLELIHRVVHRRRHDRRQECTFVQTMLGQAGTAATLVTLLYFAELIQNSDRLLEILGIDADSLDKIVKHLDGKHLVLTQKIGDLDAVVVAPVLVC